MGVSPRGFGEISIFAGVGALEAENEVAEVKLQGILHFARAEEFGVSLFPVGKVLGGTIASAELGGFDGVFVEP